MEVAGASASWTAVVLPIVGLRLVQGEDAPHLLQRSSRRDDMKVAEVSRLMIVRDIRNLVWGRQEKPVDRPGPKQELSPENQKQSMPNYK